MDIKDNKKKPTDSIKSHNYVYRTLTGKNPNGSNRYKYVYSNLGVGKQGKLYKFKKK